SALQAEVLSDFAHFNKKRIASDSKKNIYEKFYLVSSKNGLFTEDELLEKFTEKIEANRPDAALAKGNYRKVFLLEEDYDLAELYNQETTPGEDVTCIVYEVCQQTTIPLLYTKVTQEGSFSSHTDFHAMLYNDQMMFFDTHYVWVLFSWFKIKTTVVVF
ncbi:MAG: hypothetical protein WBA74_04355, partial [Cyclobacteriaceae bacterium]